MGCIKTRTGEPQRGWDRALSQEHSHPWSQPSPHPKAHSSKANREPSTVQVSCPPRRRMMDRWFPALRDSPLRTPHGPHPITMDHLPSVPGALLELRAGSSTQKGLGSSCYSPLPHRPVKRTSGGHTCTGPGDVQVKDTGKYTYLPR